MGNRSENRYCGEIASREQRDGPRWNFDISISTLFPANNSFHAISIYSHVPACTCRVKYASPIHVYVYIYRGSRSYSLTKQKFMDSAEFTSLSIYISLFVSSARGTRSPPSSMQQLQQLDFKAAGGIGIAACGSPRDGMFFFVFFFIDQRI